MKSTLRHARRSGFTLIELLVVIAIIGVLMGLTTAAVQRARESGRRASAVNDVNQLAAACATFKQEFGFYPPNEFTIPTNRNVADPNAVLINTMYSRWPLDGAASGMANAGTTLRGIQCVVYFLGGPTGTGWAIDAPVAPAANATTKKGPWFDFPTGKLTAPTLGAYLDPYGNPYGYQASKSGGSYTGWAGQPFTPYQSGGKFVSQGSVQIVSFGKDKTPGPGGAWIPGQGAYGGNGAGADDIANFNAGLQLGAQGN